MKYLVVAVALLLPLGALAAAPATFFAERDVVVASSSPANVYVAGGSVAVTAPSAADLSAAGGTLLVAAPISGDALLVGGSLDLRAPVAGDARLLGGRVMVSAPVSGDLVALAATFSDTASGERDAFIVAGEATLSGASGPVTIYANNVALSGTYAGDVVVHASGHVALAPGTVIKGSFTYESPEQASMPSSVTIAGTITYLGASYLPSSEQAHALALASVGVFLLVEVLGLLILAGLFAGLFPRLAEAVAEAALDSSIRRVLLTTLLGFAAIVATPVLLILLALTFVGLGLALVIFVAYILLALLAFIYAGITIGALLARTLWKRETILWRDGALGMLALSLIWLVPYLGGVIVFLLMAFAEGALLMLFYRHALPHEAEMPLL